MRADTGTPELGITGVDLDLFCPRGEWGDANAVREQWSMRSAKRDYVTRDAEIHVMALQVGVTIAQTRIYKKKIVRSRWRLGKKKPLPY